jgi:uncharacterized membrane protein YkoI
MSSSVRRLRKLSLLLAIGLFTAVAAHADDDHVRARRAHEAGEIVSLEKILGAVAASFTGQVVEVELERDDGRWEYEIELLTREGNVIELTYDAATGKLRDAEGAGVDAARKKP